MEAHQLVEAFADGQWHSGVEVAELLGVSRAAVWKRLQKLQQQIGLDIEREQSKGYRLRYSFRPLSQDESVLNQNDITLLPITDSTNSELSRRLHDSCFDWPDSYYCITAEQQTAGRGRRGRHWVSPYGASIYLSCGAKIPLGASAFETLSLQVGLILAEELTRLGVEGVQLKWPNDLYINGLKVAGILIEVDGDLTCSCNVIIGMGINCNYASLPPDIIDQPFTALDRYISFSRVALIASINKGIRSCLAEIVSGDNCFDVQSWAEFDYLHGKEINVHLGRTIIPCVASGISVNGYLVATLPDGSIREFAGGEVSVRIQNR